MPRLALKRGFVKSCGCNAVKQSHELLQAFFRNNVLSFETASFKFEWYQRIKNVLKTNGSFKTFHASLYDTDVIDFSFLSPTSITETLKEKSEFCNNGFSSSCKFFT